MSYVDSCKPRATALENKPGMFLKHSGAEWGFQDAPVLCCSACCGNAMTDKNGSDLRSF